MRSGSAGPETAAVHEDGGDGAQSSRLRADARRNRAQILAAAEAAFAEEGIGVPVDEIARRAGVGAGTLYRNFPTKEHLFEAVIARHMESLAARARELSDSDEPGRALFEFIGALVTEASAKRNLIDAMTGAGIDVKETMAPHKAQVEQAAQVLLERAQGAGVVRPDVTLADVFALVMGACAFAGAETSECSQARITSVVCDGLRSTAV
ncbi:MAG TPA: TetR/AcrR family transcriptional regulator [Acidimicrobiales bacterium]|nr:TetR/AcrR family transcriptional regulator [Acidimicrobiales bacterium]